MCRELGYPHPDYLLEQLTSAQLSEWQAYDTIDPIGKFRDDYRTGYLVSSIVNLVLQLTAKKGHKPKLVEVKDCMIYWDEELKKDVTHPSQSIEQMKAALYSIARSNGLKIKTKKDKL